MQPVQQLTPKHMPPVQDVPPGAAPVLSQFPDELQTSVVQGSPSTQVLQVTPPRPQRVALWEVTQVLPWTQPVQQLPEIQVPPEHEVLLGRLV